MANDPTKTLNARLSIEVLLSPFVSFAKIEAAGGILLMASTVAALIWANSSWAGSYHALWDAQTTVGLGRFALTETNHEWINDGLMAVFFFLVGLEIKREVLIGELSSLRQAAFPLISAVGGAILPALMYVSVAHDSQAIKGWAIPMATDIAFVLGVLAILGSRVTVTLKIFVTALAIADDLIAVLVIAIFYTERIQWMYLAGGLVVLGLCFGANFLGIRKPVVYAILGIFLWYAMLKSGVHATVAGVLLAFTIPSNTSIDRGSFVEQCRSLLNRFEGAHEGSPETHSSLHAMHQKLELVESPLHRIEHALHPWVSFAIMPLFAFSNAGVRILGNVAAATRHPVSLGVALGLFVGKPLGIWSFAWMSAKLRLASTPSELSWRALFGAAWLSGIGFTMSLFIGTLAFGEGDLLSMAKIGILGASVAAGVCGSLFLLRVNHAVPSSYEAQSSQE
jgi:NhaA family Na+:H+ antiporter